MKKRYLKKIAALMLLASFMLSGTVYSGATGEDNSPVINNGSITSEVAQIIAEFFVADASKAMPELSWTLNTTVSEVVPMYDTNGYISAYSCELETDGTPSGYVIVAGYADSTSNILEFSDTAAPVYQLFTRPYSASSGKVIYTGALNYYFEDGDTVKDIYNVSYDIDSVSNGLEELRTGIMPATLIDDPFEYANENYAGPFEHDESNPYFNNICTYWTTSDYPLGEENCGPTAITNLLRMVGEIKNNAYVKSKSDAEIYTDVVSIGTNNGYYDVDEGTYRSSLNQYLRVCFANYGMSSTVSSYTGVTYERAKTEIDNHRPFYISLINHTNYGNHGVAALAYTRLQSSSTGYYKSFVKIADGWLSDGRYLDIADIGSGDSIMRTIR